ncbi:hypothetical protein ACJJTC_001129 [Scirpophaga incertulas]
MKARPEPGCKAPLATTNVFRSIRDAAWPSEARGSGRPVALGVLADTGAARASGRGPGRGGRPPAGAPMGRRPPASAPPARRPRAARRTTHADGTPRARFFFAARVVLPYLAFTQPIQSQDAFAKELNVEIKSNVITKY